MTINKTDRVKLRKPKLSDDGLELVKFVALKQFLDIDGRTQGELAEAYRKFKHGKGITGSVVSDYANERRPMGEAHARVIAHVLGVPPRYLSRRITKDEFVEFLRDNEPADLELAKPADEHPLPDTAPDQPTDDTPDWKKPKLVWVQEDQDKVSGFLGSIDQIEIVEIPVYGPGSIAAGVPDDWPGDYAPQGIMLVPARAVKKHIQHYGVPVAGDSMEGVGIMHGMTVAVRPEPYPDMGQIVVALVEGSAVVKRMVLDINSIPVLLSETLPPGKYADIPITEHVIIVGVVVWWGQQQGRPQPEHPARKAKKKTK